MLLEICKLNRFSDWCQRPVGGRPPPGCTLSLLRSSPAKCAHGRQAIERHGSPCSGKRKSGGGRRTQGLLLLDLLFIARDPYASQKPNGSSLVLFPLA
jgi:hypothetical protein